MVQVESGGRMNDVLYELCCHYINTNDCSNAPVSSRSVSFRLNLTVSQTRYRLRKLKKLGYVETPSGFVISEFCSLPYHGWTITDKAKETEEYKKAWKEERALCKKCFDMDIGEQE